MLKRILGIFGIAAIGVGTVVYLAIGMGFAIGGVLFLWWISDFFYDQGLWPLGLVTRIPAVMGTLALALGAISMVVALVVIIFSLISAPFRR